MPGSVGGKKIAVSTNSASPHLKKKILSPGTERARDVRELARISIDSVASYVSVPLNMKGNLR